MSVEPTIRRAVEMPPYGQPRRPRRLLERRSPAVAHRAWTTTCGRCPHSHSSSSNEFQKKEKQRAGRSSTGGASRLHRRGRKGTHTKQARSIPLEPRAKTVAVQWGRNPVRWVFPHIFQLHLQRSHGHEFRWRGLPRQWFSASILILRVLRKRRDGRWRIRRRRLFCQRGELHVLRQRRWSRWWHRAVARVLSLDPEHNHFV